MAVGHFDAHGATVGAKVTGPGRMLIMMGTSSCHELMCTEEKWCRESAVMWKMELYLGILDMRQDRAV